MVSETPEKLITVAEAAKALSVSPITVRRHVSTVAIGRKRLVRMSSVAAIIAGEVKNAAA